jgi:hypothetical protein
MFWIEQSIIKHYKSFNSGQSATHDAALWFLLIIWQDPTLQYVYYIKRVISNKVNDWARL